MAPSSLASFGKMTVGGRASLCIAYYSFHHATIVEIRSNESRVSHTEFRNPVKVSAKFPLIPFFFFALEHLPQPSPHSRKRIFWPPAADSPACQCAEASAPTLTRTEGTNLWVFYRAAAFRSSLKQPQMPSCAFFTAPNCVRGAGRALGL